MTVRSTQLGIADGVTAGDHDLYTVPSGRRTILKTLQVRNNTAGAITWSWYIKPTGGGRIDFFLPMPASPGAGSTATLNLWTVLNAGDVLGVTGVAGSGIDCIASGAELVT